MGPFLLQKVGDSNSKHGPWNPEKSPQQEELLTKISRYVAIGKYHRTIP